MISKKTVDEVQAIPIMEVIDKFYKGKLKRAGTTYKGLSPFKVEKTPSFCVVSKKNFFKDFSCGYGGNAVKFVMLIKNISYPSAIREIAREFNINISTDEPERYSALNSKSQTVKQDRIALDQPTLIPIELFRKSVTAKAPNNFLSFMESKVGSFKMEEIRKRYPIGTSNRWPGATIFWQVDEKGNVRYGKVMLFDKITAKRVKKHIDSVHSILSRGKRIGDYNLSQCLFGLNQLTNFKVTEIGIVESEKTAIVASVYLPELTWMASGSKCMLSSKILSPIKTYPIILYPDLGASDDWKLKADELSASGYKVIVSNLLETASFVTDQDKASKFDLADYLLRLNAPEGTCLERLISKHPSIRTLIDRLDLVSLNNNALIS